MSILIVVAMLVLLIVIHELGHFIVAKLTGVKVEEFGIGYPPKAVSMGKIGETEYTLNWLPFGGFVRLFGESGEEHGKKSFTDASRLSQAAILAAGVIANIVFAWMLFTVGFMVGMPTAVSEDVPGARLLISGIVPSSPAASSGLQVGDEITSVTDAKGESSETLAPSSVAAFISERGGDAVSISYLREGETGQITLVPAHAVLEDESGRPALGVALTPIAEKRLPFFSAIYQAGNHTILSLYTVTKGLGGIFVDAISGGLNVKNLVGPVGLVSVVGDASGHGIGHLIGLAAFISVNLAIINLIPIPALDGGRLLFVGIEAIRGRAISHRVTALVNTLGFLAIVALMIAVTYNDIARLVFP